MRSASSLALLGILIVGVIAHASATAANAENVDWPAWWPRILGAQLTVIDQGVLPFHSPYQGPNSFKANGDDEISHTYGLYFGSRVFPTTEVYADVEMGRGTGISNATGVGGFTNGDVIRIGTVNLGEDPYLARAFLRQIIPLGPETVDLERQMDQLPGREPARRVEIKLGKLALPDDFDLNRYANSTRTQFLNWSFFNNTAWDFAADTRGYSNGVTVAWLNPGWALRFAVYQVVTFANGNVFDDDLLRAQGNNVELTLGPFTTGTVVRLLGYANQGRMGDYREAIARARAVGQAPSIAADERPGRLKYGFGLNLEQPITDDGETGAFARLGWNDGNSEDFMFSEVDHLFSGGVQVSGSHWGRPSDRIGLAYAAEGLSTPHRRYLAAGGSGFMLGDGRLNYDFERVFEMYYRWQVLSRVQVSPDFQYIENPGYNRDRGPAFVFALRLHVAY